MGAPKSCFYPTQLEGTAQPMYRLHPSSDYADPELNAVVHRMCTELAAQPGRYGEPHPYKVDTGSFDGQTLYARAEQMCNEGEFEKALPIALHLTVSAGHRAGAFMAGTCLQRLDEP